MILRAFFLAPAAVPFLFLLALALPAQAQYRWTDDKGVTRVTETPPPPGAKNVRKLDGNTPKPAPAATTQVPYEVARAQKDFPVTLYTSPSCKEGCELARAALNKRGVPFKEVQVWNQETNEELKTATGGGEVPALIVGRSVHRGFEQGAFDSLLDSAGYPKAGTVPAGTQKAPGAPEGYVAPGGPAETAKPVSDQTAKPGPYDPSGLKGPEPKPGIYDPSGLKGPEPKRGPYGVPADTKK
jgi:glutaredoxin